MEHAMEKTSVAAGYVQVSQMKGVAAAMVTGIDMDGDGIPDCLQGGNRPKVGDGPAQMARAMYIGADLDGDGIPDALQRGPNLTSMTSTVEDKHRLFISGQHTAWAWRVCKAVFKQLNAPLPPDGATYVSAPPFNLPELPEGSESFPKEYRQLNVPCYGGILDEIMELFKDSDFLRCAREMRVKIPEYKIDSFLKGKMEIVREMVEAAKARSDCNDQNTQAAERLKAFADAFECINDADFQNLNDWNRFMNDHVGADWRMKLSFEKVLSNFGFDDEFASALRQQTTEERDDKLGTTQTVTWEYQGLRWVSKAMTGFKPAGCLTDVVNLVFAMKRYNPSDVEAGITESKIIEVIKEFRSEVNDPTKLWVPTHLIVDCESDDMLAWCLVKSIHERTKTQPSVIAQLPTDEEANSIAQHLEHDPRCKILRDPESRNMKALSQYWSFLKPKD